MDTSDNEIREILKANLGFDDLENWVSYAKKNDFKKVAAKKITNCPDCKSDKKNSFGQYIYYSNLIHLLHCNKCGLIYSNARIDQSVIKQHFETAYKDQNYFSVKRSKVFKQISDLINKHCKQNSQIIDYGGACGFQLDAIKKDRKDINCIPVSYTHLTLPTTPYV